jgi:hypothetical protein
MSTLDMSIPLTPRRVDDITIISSLRERLTHLDLSYHFMHLYISGACDGGSRRGVGPSLISRLPQRTIDQRVHVRHSRTSRGSPRHHYMYGPAPGILG